MNARPNASWVVVATLLVALILSIWQLPATAIPFWPRWVVLVVIYWCLALPNRIGIGIAWVIGLLLDVLSGTMLGEHALALAVIAFLVLKIHLQVRVFPLWQQTLTVALMIVLYQFMLLWIDGAVGLPAQPLVRWLPVVTSLLIWPWLMSLLRHLRRRYQVR
ncbi:MAG TPA: rod shape-determining protein MreD [Gammaproteobacteria bacterium]|nr:rod shape-determining protein MreD [Gammaproteobacteria bacterium]